MSAEPPQLTPAERLSALYGKNALEELRQGCLAQAVDEFWATPRAMLHRPEPLVAERGGLNPGHRLDGRPGLSDGTGDPADQPVRYSADSEGRITRATGRWPGGADEELLTYGDGWVEVVSVMHGSVITDVMHAFAREGRVTEVRTSLGAVETYRYDADGRLLGWVEEYPKHDVANDIRCLHDPASGELETIFFKNRGSDLESVVYDARLLREEEPGPSLEELATHLAEGLHRAVAAATRQALGRLAPADEAAAVGLWMSRQASGGHVSLPPAGVLLTERHIRQVRRTDPEIEDRLFYVPEGSDTAVQLDVLGAADRETLRRVRQLNQRIASESGEPLAERTAVAAAARILREVCARLNGDPAPLPLVVLAARPDGEFWPHLAYDEPHRDPEEEHELIWAAEPYLGLSERGQYSFPEVLAHERRWWLAARLADPARVHDLRMMLRPEGPAADPSLDEGPPPATRAELRELAASLGLGRVADAIASDALIGLALGRDTGGGARSHLGGAPCLPADLSWPCVPGEDRPIAFMASIDCAELPDADGRELLPADGTLLFFADTALGGSVHWGWGEPGTGGRIRVHHVPAGTPVERVPPPAVLLEPDEECSTQVLGQVPVLARPVLTLPESWLARDRYGLTPGESVAYDRLWDRCSTALDDPAGRDGLTDHHQILGHPESLQDDPRGGDQVLLLLVSSDGATGLAYQDGGCVYYLAEPEDLRAGRFDRVIGADASH
jgi:YD repeat-containing protein